MGRRGLLLGIVVLCLAFAVWRGRWNAPPPARGAERPGQSLLANGSFEAGLQGWTGDGFRVIEAGTGAYHGTHVLEVVPPDDPEELRTGVLSLPLRLEPERGYRFSIAIQSSFEDGRPRFGVCLGSAALYHELAGLPPGPTSASGVPERGNWRRSEFVFFASRREETLVLGPLSRFEPQVDWGPMWIDDVRLEPLDVRRTLGLDFDLQATLPSTAAAGEELELALVSLGHRRPTTRSPFASDFSLQDPVPLRETFELHHEGGTGELPERVHFEGEARKSLRVRFDSPGVHRVLLRSGDYLARSNPVLVETSAPARRAYWGDVHIHTRFHHADWYGGDGDQNYRFARDVADLDFAALSEHYGGLSFETWLEGLAPISLRFDEPGRFATFLALETGTVVGHWNFYLRGGDPRQMFPPEDLHPDKAMTHLRELAAPFLVIPHHFMLLDPVDWRLSDRESLRLAEIYSQHGTSEEAGRWWRHPLQSGLRYDDSQGARGHDYRSALARGRRLGVIACSDDHSGRPGLSGLTCALATGLERGALFDALRERRCYATTGARMLLDFSVAGAPQGSEVFLAAGLPLEARLEVHGSAPLERVELLRDGSLVESYETRGLDLVELVPLGDYDGRSTYLQARVIQADEHRGWSSPIWIDPSGVPDLVLERKDLLLEGGALQVEVHNYGDGPARAGVSLHSSELDPRLADRDPSGLNQLGFCVRLEPVDDRRVRIKALLFTPASVQTRFRYSGRIDLAGAEGVEVVVDPRGMLERQGSSLTWEQEYGYHYKDTQSASGQLCDFEVLVTARPGTTVVLSPRCGEQPLRLLLGEEPVDGPDLVLAGLHGLASRTRIDRREVEIDPRGAARLSFPAGGPATYLVVLDPDDAVHELREDNNAWPLVVPGLPELDSGANYSPPGGSR